MDKTIILAGKDLCTGCGACKAVCPKGAITIGFGSGKKAAKREGLVDMDVYSRK